eukprot:766842-Hanusia_phi.AAC.8
MTRCQKRVGSACASSCRPAARSGWQLRPVTGPTVRVIEGKAFAFPASSRVRAPNYLSGPA